MYEELVKRLRKRAVNLKEKFTKNAELLAELTEAADAIEELQYDLDIAVRAEAAATEACKPRWIPVTERLPEENQIVVVHEGKGTWDFGMFRGISPSGNPEYWHWKKNTLKRVKWWMPKDGALPEPPKEEHDG